MSVDLLSPLRRPTSIAKIHESCYRSWETLDMVIWLLDKKTPHEVILNYIQSIRDAEHMNQETP